MPEQPPGPGTRATGTGATDTGATDTERAIERVFHEEPPSGNRYLPEISRVADTGWPTLEDAEPEAPSELFTEGWTSPGSTSDTQRSLQQFENQLDASLVAPPRSFTDEAALYPVFHAVFSTAPRNLWRDQLNFYHPTMLAKLGILLGVSAAIANSSADREWMEYYQDHIRSDGTDKLSHWVKPFGDGVYTLPVVVGVTILANSFDKLPLSDETAEWGGRTIRGWTVGAAPFIAFSYILGSSRPDQSGHNSRWVPWKDKHGVSGHAFMSAVPFITAAQMTDNPWLKAAFYAGSTVTGWSRWNDHDHYLSQVVMGWGLAYLAASAVRETEEAGHIYSIVPIPAGHGYGFGIEFRR
jgi:membrane-associated phospholipid phosphatase